jgi:gamma-glutamylcyclotransferase (GGCT)/AIG2-like uncharacterized protein YtfP
MDGDFLYFAYGSNMALERLRSRASSAIEHGRFRLTRHRLAFHKVSQRDGSAKCDAVHTGNEQDSVHGILYGIHHEQMALLDSCEGRGYGYERKQITVLSENNQPESACSYFATLTDPKLKPFDWYKEHVVRGAVSWSLPPEYIQMIKAVPSVPDPDPDRRERELAIYG